MKLIRTSQTCDIELEIFPGGIDGFQYTINVMQEDKHMEPYCSRVNQVDAYDALVRLYNEPNLRVPAKFVLEFANHVIADLSRKVLFTQTSTKTDSTETILSYCSDGTSR